MNFDPTIILLIPVLLLSLTLHEYGHAWIAQKGGDYTATHEGRVTFDPLNHIDIFGTILVPLLLFLSGQSVFGWARPVPVNTLQLRKRIWIVYVTLAGPAANVLIAVVTLLALKGAFLIIGPQGFEDFLDARHKAVGISGAVYQTAYLLITINFALAIFNMVIPIPPLDGSKIFQYYVLQHNREWDEMYSKITPFGFMIIYMLFRIPGTGHLLHKIIDVPIGLGFRFLAL